jgi:hypothetical protein
LNNFFRLERFVARTTFGVEELQQLLQGLRVRPVTQKRAFPADFNETLGLQLFEMMRKSRGGDVEFVLDLADDKAIGMRGEQKLHDAETWLCAHGGEHVSEASDLIGTSLDGSSAHASIIAEIPNVVKQELARSPAVEEAA